MSRSILANQGVAAWALVCLSVLVPMARAEPIYEVVSFGGAGLADLNDLGQVLLNRGGETLIWDSGFEQVLYNGIGKRLNNSGQVIGQIGQGADSRQVVYRAGVVNEIGAGRAWVQNEMGQVIYSESFDTHFIWQDGVLSPFPSELTSELELAQFTGLNNAGVIVGGLASTLGDGFRLKDGVLTKFGNTVYGVNEAGDLIYHQETGLSGDSFLVTSAGEVQLQSLPDPEEPWDLFAFAESLNNLGQVVGYSEGRGVLWNSSGEVTDLSTLLRSVDAARWRIEWAYKINDNSEILARAVDLQQPGQYQQVLLRESFDDTELVPEPSSILLACLGLAGVGLFVLPRRHRSRDAVKVVG